MKWIKDPKKTKKTIRQLEERITKKYSYMFPRQKPGTPLLPIVFGFEVGPGWYDLLENMFNTIALIDINKTVIIQQVKEKFGGLRFYYGHNEIRASEEIYDAISFVVRCGESISEHTCEECGEWGKIIGGGWLYCRCKKCEKRLKKERFI